MKTEFFKLKVQAYRRESEMAGGVHTHRTVEDGFLTGDVYIEIDDRLLRRLAEKALKAKSRRAQVGSGLIICKARNIKKVPA